MTKLASSLEAKVLVLGMGMVGVLLYGLVGGLVSTLTPTHNPNKTLPIPTHHNQTGA